MKHLLSFILICITGISSCQTGRYIYTDMPFKNTGKISIALIVLEEGIPPADDIESKLGQLLEENRYEAVTGLFTEKFYGEKIYDKITTRKDSTFVHKQHLTRYADWICRTDIRYETEKPQIAPPGLFFRKCTITLLFIQLSPFRLVKKLEYSDFGGAEKEENGKREAFTSCLLKMRKFLPFDLNHENHETDPHK